MVAGSTTEVRGEYQANIGSFKKVNDEFQARSSPERQARGVQHRTEIQPDQRQAPPTGLRGRAEIARRRPKRSMRAVTTSRSSSTIRASPHHLRQLFDGDDDTYNLIWSAAAPERR